MRRFLTLCLLVVLGVDLHAASPAIRSALYHGTWSVTNARTEAVTSGPVSVVFPATGKPIVHLWIPEVVEDGTNYIEFFRTASQPNRRSIAWTLPRLGRLSGKHSPDNQILRTISGQLRLNALGRGTFGVTQAHCGFGELNSGIPLQLVLRDVYNLPCELAQIQTNMVVITNRPPGGFFPHPPTNLPPILPPTISTNSPSIVTSRVDTVRSNLVPIMPILTPPIITPLTPVTDSTTANSGVIVWRLADLPSPYTNREVLWVPATNASGQVIRAWTTQIPTLVTPQPPITTLPHTPTP